MFFGFDLKEIFYFPIKDAEARKQLLIGGLVSLAGFIIPLIPFFFLYGYAIQIARQVLNGESPRMIAWNDWGSLFKDGAKMIGIRFIFSLPIIVLILPMMIASFILPVAASNSNDPASNPFLFVFMGIFSLTLCVMIPVSIAFALVIPAAEMHVVETGDFAAGFRFHEWWAIFRANTGGFIAAFAVYYLAAMALTILIQILAMTIILSCLLPILLPAVTIYIVLIMYAAIAQAYRDGKAKLRQANIVKTLV